MTSLEAIVDRFKIVPVGESIAAAVERSVRFVEQCLVEGHGPAVQSGLTATKMRHARELVELPRELEAILAARVRPEAAWVSDIEQAQKRWGAPLQRSLRELWEYLSSAEHRRWVHGFMPHELVEPSELLRAAPELRLAEVHDGTSVRDVRERFMYDYEEWWDDEENQELKLSKPEQMLTLIPRYSPKGPLAGKNSLLDPRLRDGMIYLASWHSESWFIVSGLASEQAPAPVFSNHDDDAGMSRFCGADVRAWFSQEVSLAMIKLIDGE